MKILLLPSYFLPEEVSSPYISWNRNQAFVDEGWDILVFTPVPCRGLSLDVCREYKKRKLEYMLDGRMIVHRFNLMKEKKNPILRAFRYIAQNVIQFNRAVFTKEGRAADVMLITSTPPTQGAMAALAKKITKTPIVYNLQDIFPDSLVGTGLSHKGSFLWKIGRMIENFTYRNADKIIVISEGFKKNIMAKGVPENKIEVVYNWVETEKIFPVDKSHNPLFEEFGISRDKFIVLYAGNLGNAQNIDIIIDAAAKLKNEDNVEFVLFGSGGLEDNIKVRREVEMIKNLNIFPFQLYEKVSYVYSMGDVCIVPCKAGLGGSAMPSKTWSILATSTPVLANFDEGELKEILEGQNCGVFTKAGDLDSFVAAIEFLSKNRDKCSEMGINGRKFVMNNLTKEVGTRKYVDVIKSVVKIKV